MPRGSWRSPSSGWLLKMAQPSFHAERTSWGRIPRARQNVIPLRWISDAPDLRAWEGPVLPYGLGRSYGDSCLNDGGTLLETSHLDRFFRFDSQTGILRCESGVTLSAILELFVPRGWFLPVSPGTQFVTVGGAIANDIHGKNHHRAGTFGRHVPSFELLRSSGDRLLCSASENADLYRATIGGLGLTGLILWAEVQLKPIPGPWIERETIPFADLEEFFAISRGSDRDFEYTVAWVDGFSKGGRGLFFRGRHVPDGDEPPRGLALSIPFDFPAFVLNRCSMTAFNRLYYDWNANQTSFSRLPLHSFFYPLDTVGHWNRIYGRRGFFQYQCVVPLGEPGRRPMAALMEAVTESGQGSFLSVLKVFGGLPSPGLMSFPRPGATLALDFPN